MGTWRVRGRVPLRGAVVVPGDKSIAHRALICAALSDGRCVLRGVPASNDVEATRRALEMLGVGTERVGADVVVDGRGFDGFRAPSEPIDCAASGTTLRLLAGLLAGQEFESKLTAGASLRARPMSRIVEPLRARGAMIAGTLRFDVDDLAEEEPIGGELFAPLTLAGRGGQPLRGLEHSSPVASAHVKGALLLSGLYAAGPTALAEPAVSRDHTERMFLTLGAPLETVGPILVFDPSGWQRSWKAFDWTLPGDVSTASVVAAAALTVPGSAVTLNGVGVNPTRTGFFRALRSMGGAIEISARGDAAGGEPTAQVRVTSSALRSGHLADELFVHAIDEAPLFAAVGALARGTTRIEDAIELRFKESDRLSEMTKLLDAFGVRAEEHDEGIVVHAGATRPAEVTLPDDHRIAFAALVLALATEGVSTLSGIECVAKSWPDIREAFQSLGARIEEVA